MDQDIKPLIDNLPDPEDYFSGIRGAVEIGIPNNILVFHRATVEKLQQNALQNRSHHRFVLIFNLGAAGHVHANHRLLHLEPGQALLVFPFQFHHFSQLEQRSVNWLFITFELSHDRMLAVMRNRTVHFKETLTTELAQVLTDWETANNEHEPNSTHPEILRASLWRMLMKLKEGTLKGAEDIPPEPQENLLRIIHQLLLESAGQVLRIQDLAQKLLISEASLRVKFKVVSGLSLGKYLQNFRINRAMSLLQTTQQSIADVAEEAGFASPQAFSRTFKKEVGVSPQYYRMQRTQ